MVLRMQKIEMRIPLRTRGCALPKGIILRKAEEVCKPLIYKGERPGWTGVPGKRWNRVQGEPQLLFQRRAVLRRVIDDGVSQSTELLRVLELVAESGRHERICPRWDRIL